MIRTANLPLLLAKLLFTADPDNCYFSGVWGRKPNLDEFNIDL
jgi:hypothetical protein